MQLLKSACIVLTAMAIVSPSLAAEPRRLTVPAKSDIFLAGLSVTPRFPGGAGLAPVSIPVTGGAELTITAEGEVSCCGGSPTNGPDGGGYGGDASITGFGKVAGFRGKLFGLVGVFGGPALKSPWRPFVVGSSKTVVVPAGATRLYLGFADGEGFGGHPGHYDDNTGELSVTVQ